MKPGGQVYALLAILSLFAACEHSAEQMSYAELNAQANRVAHYLVAQGVATGECVGICLPRSLDVAVAMLGILKAGAVYVALDTVNPAERLPVYPVAPTRGSDTNRSPSAWLVR